MKYLDAIHIHNTSSTTVTRIGTIFGMVLYDNPQIFYTSTQGYRIEQTELTIILKPKYFFPLQSVFKLQNLLNESVANICAPITDIEDDFSKEIYIHNYLTQNVKYSKTDVAQPINAYTVAGTLLEGNSVCAGIALSFKLLMDYLDIPCIVATGVATNNDGHTERHAWNLAYIGDFYYQIDVTWDLLDGENERVIKYDYFNLTSQEMYRSRIPDYEYPLCIDSFFNYFSYMNAIVYSPSELILFISNKILQGEQRIYFKYAFDFDTMKEKLKRYLNQIPLLGKYRYWINETVHTVFLIKVQNERFS